MTKRASPEEAATTNPAVVKAIVKEVLKYGGVPMVGDSPGVEAEELEEIYRQTGISKAAEEVGAMFLKFEEEIEKQSTNKNNLLKDIPVAKPVFDADLVISVPKLKTHDVTLLTGAVKNMFGIIVGKVKHEIHKKALMKGLFGETLIDIFNIRKPALAIMDGIVAMEGNGPGKGIPRKVGVILASKDCFALDIIASRIIGVNPLEVMTNKAVIKQGLLEGTENIEVVGNSFAQVMVNDFLLPDAWQGE